MRGYIRINPPLRPDICAKALLHTSVLLEQLTADLKEALKTGNDLKASTLRMLLSAIHNREIEKRTKLAKENKSPEPLTEEEALEIVMSEAKKRREAVEVFAKAGRAELVQKEKEELAILEAYLPKHLSEEEIVKEVEAAIQATGARSAKDIGKVMGYLSPRLKGKADMGKVSKMVVAKLTG